ncbi:mandelate racemase/muconate lactonizing enzyme family protein [Demequina flava]|uniref:mandelate racemase/muconate lactonizing enzyme family protein n=1 Tax=Demequina flava TaxID=1095025 RepID=UPI0007841012|nr:mandelate racemase/muconate lactonizing enzyme family protein [Demequina flava]
MKITGYRHLTTVRDWGRPIGDVNGIITSGKTPTDVVIVETDEGIEGISLGSVALIESVFPAIEGRDPRAVAALYDSMLAHTFKAGHQGAVFGTIGTLDTALWDIKAKAAGEPLWRLLGAEDRLVPGYASGLDYGLTDEELHHLYMDFAERGFTGGKLKGGTSSTDDVRRLGILSDALQRNCNTPALMLDANESWNLKEAIRYMDRILDEVDLAWIEEPLRRWDYTGLARLSSTLKSAVASGENLTGLEQFTPLIDSDAVDIVQAGANWGITHFLRVAAAAHFHHLPVSPVGLTANPSVAHAAAAVPNHMAAEVQHLGQPFGITVDEEVADGGIVLGEAPGAGLTVDEVQIQGSAVEPEEWGVHNGPHVRAARAGRQLL